MADNDELRATIRALRSELKSQKERYEKLRRQLGGTQAALNRAQQKVKELQKELGANYG